MVINIEKVFILCGNGMDEVLLYTPFVGGASPSGSENQVFKTYVQAGAGKEFVENTLNVTDYKVIQLNMRVG